VPAFSVLAGVFLTWSLNNISRESDHVQNERARNQSKLENYYVDVVACIEAILRSKIKGSNFEDMIAHSSSVLALFSSKDVQIQFTVFSVSFEKYRNSIKDGEKDYRRYTDARCDFPKDWVAVTSARESIIEAMKEHITSLDFYCVQKKL